MQMNSGEFFESYPVNPEHTSEYRERVITRAQKWREKLLSVNTGHTDNLRSHGLPTTEQYVIRSAANEAVPVSHDRFELSPRLRLPTVEGIALLRVRVPLVELYDHLDESDSELPTTDICFELINEDKSKRPERYLLNAAGFWPYFDATDLQPNTDIDRPGMFVIPGTLNDPRDYEKLDLIHELLFIYRPKQLDNRPADVA